MIELKRERESNVCITECYFGNILNSSLPSQPLVYALVCACVYVCVRARARACGCGWEGGCLGACLCVSACTRKWD